MLSISHTWRATAVIAVAALTSCASTGYHYSQLVGKRYFRAPIDTYDLSIVRVDGKDTVLRPVLVDPGVHQVVVQGPPGATHAPGVERAISLNVQPCTRYYLVAVLPNRLSPSFDVRVDYQEPVAGCTPPATS
jgi:hypothetical protein